MVQLPDELVFETTTEVASYDPVHGTRSVLESAPQGGLDLLRLVHLHSVNSTDRLENPPNPTMLSPLRQPRGLRHGCTEKRIAPLSRVP